MPCRKCTTRRTNKFGQAGRQCGGDRNRVAAAFSLKQRRDAATRSTTSSGNARDRISASFAKRKQKHNYAEGGESGRRVISGRGYLSAKMKLRFVRTGPPDQKKQKRGID